MRRRLDGFEQSSVALVYSHWQFFTYSSTGLRICIREEEVNLLGRRTAKFTGAQQGRVHALLRETRDCNH